MICEKVLRLFDDKGIHAYVSVCIPILTSIYIQALESMLEKSISNIFKVFTSTKCKFNPFREVT